MGRRKRLAIVLVGLVAVGVLFAAGWPGYFRLFLIQPARDAAYFVRELQPFDHYAVIETRTPRADAHLVLPPSRQSQYEIEIAMDIWVPDTVPAPVAMLLHGSSPRGRRLGLNMMLADKLRDAGWLVLTPDARGFGDSKVRDHFAEPRAWRVDEDLRRLVEFASNHPDSNGIVVGIGHSHGANNLVDAGFGLEEFSALVLLGPGRSTGDGRPTYWYRVRFASDRGLARPMHVEVVADYTSRRHPRRFEVARTKAAGDVPILLMDGQREGDRLIATLAEVAERMEPPATHVTILGSHHYCGAYQLPFLDAPVFVRPDVFDRCASTILSFIAENSNEQ